MENNVDWFLELFKVGTSFVLGAFSGLLWPWLRDWTKRKRETADRARRKVAALTHVNNISSEILDAVSVEPHGVDNKANWVKRLDDLACRNRDWLGDSLSFAVEKLAWRIEDNTFSHEHGKPPYCCDQLQTDLQLLKLAVLPLVADAQGWDENTLRLRELEQMKLVWESFQEVRLASPEPGQTGEELLEKEARDKAAMWYQQLKEGKFRVGGYLALATYFEHAPNQPM